MVGDCIKVVALLVIYYYCHTETESWSNHNHWIWELNGKADPIWFICVCICVSGHYDEKCSGFFLYSNLNKRF